MAFLSNAQITPVGSTLLYRLSLMINFNNTEKGDSKLTGKQMRKVLKGYLKLCKGLYKM